MGPCLSSFYFGELGSKVMEPFLPSDPFQTDPGANLFFIEIYRFFFSCRVFEASHLIE